MAPDLPRPNVLTKEQQPLYLHYVNTTCQNCFWGVGTGMGVYNVGQTKYHDSSMRKANHMVFHSNGHAVIRSTDDSLMRVYTFQACISKNISVEINAIWQGFQTCVLISLQASKLIGVSKCIYIGMMVPVGLIAIMDNESGHTPSPKTVVYASKRVGYSRCNRTSCCQIYSTLNCWDTAGWWTAPWMLRINKMSRVYIHK